MGTLASSVEKTTFRWRIPRFLNSFRMILAKGQLSVLEISVTLKAVGSNLLAEPMEEMMGIFWFVQRVARSNFAVTVSIQSIT